MTNEWTPTPLSEVATRYIESVRVDPDAMYTSLGVKWYGEGVFAREPRAGSAIRASKVFRVQAGQFIYNRMFVTEGSFGLVPEALSDGVVSNEFPTYDVDRTRLLPEWLRLKFQDPAVVDVVANQAKGTTKSRRRWKEDQFESFVVNLPPVPTQRRIVDLFSRLDRVLQLTEEEGAAARQAVSALREHRLKPSEDWRETTIGEELIRESRPVVVDPSAEYSEIGLRSHGRGAFLKDSLSGEALGKKRVFFVEPGDLCFNIVFAWEGAVAVLGPEVAGRIASHRFPTFKGAEVWTAAWFDEFFRTRRGRQLLVDHSPGGAGRNKTLAVGRLMEQVVSVPTEAQAVESLEVLKAIDDAARAAQDYTLRLKGLRAQLLRVLMSGEHKIPAGYDVLLSDEGSEAPVEGAYARA
ncbi:hypothetical protein ACL9RL_18495 [Plantibacter sp. Mn2098]|uniref:hypothetical protein n=1 Tax=Plantibacter sp. Mn2098 TaxID=3395266 RepID=UPI003BC62663